MLKLTAVRLVSAILFLFALSACGHSDSQVSGPAAAVQTTTHQGVGKVTALNPNVPSIEIDHEDIKDFMPAMHMEFRVRDKSLLSGLSVGDRIGFTVENGVTGMQVTAIAKK